MIFRLVKPETINLPVAIEVPDGEAGTVVLIVKYLTNSEVQVLLKEVFESRRQIRDGKVPTIVSDFDLAKRLVVGWGRIGDEKGNEIAFSEQALGDAMDIRYFQNAVGDALLEHLLNGRKKNSTPLDANGPEESTT